MDENLGLSSILKRGSSKALKLLWIIILIMSIFLLMFYVLESYVKFRVSPEILINQRLVSSETVPFPAVTICPLELRLQKSENLSRVLASCHVNEKEYISDLCFNKSVNLDTKELNKVLNEISLNVDDVLGVCTVRGASLASYNKCKHIFNRVLTNHGYCFTYNMLGHHSLFNMNISKNFDSYKRKNITKPRTVNDTKEQFHNDERKPEPPRWSLEDGYSTNETVTPVRGLDLIALFVETNFTQQEVNIFLHLPNELPKLHGAFKLKKGLSVELKLGATVNVYDESLKNFPEQERECYFKEEKPLQYLKSYTRENCEEECRANFTLWMCGCARLTTLRSDDSNICRGQQTFCAWKIVKNWPVEFYREAENRERFPTYPCSCMPPCTQINYQIIQETSVEVKNATSVSIIFHNTYVSKTTHYVTYKLHNFVADIGGLAGLFLGTSLLSVFEIVLNVMNLMKYVISMCVRKIISIKKAKKKVGTRRVKQKPLVVIDLIV